MLNLSYKYLYNNMSLFIGFILGIIFVLVIEIALCRHFELIKEFVNFKEANMTDFDYLNKLSNKNKVM